MPKINQSDSIRENVFNLLNFLHGLLSLLSYYFMLHHVHGLLIAFHLCCFESPHLICSAVVFCLSHIDHSLHGLTGAG